MYTIKVIEQLFLQHMERNFKKEKHKLKQYTQYISVSYKFGMITMLAGLIGVPMGSIMAQRLRHRAENADPYICAAGLLISAPMVYMALVLPQTSSSLCFLFIFGAQVALNLCWSIVADILLVRFKFTHI